MFVVLILILVHCPFFAYNYLNGLVLNIEQDGVDIQNNTELFQVRLDLKKVK